ncbi:acyl-CoA-binding protein [Streptomyces sp. NBC_01230]|uniref:hypothetical protein n=1 Tax=unclassified Streptomyces TaxID=2593676 RepID=UPI002E14FEAA|nr:acyl-CoA-binding protein [Streptomyces sp. NBC_01230]
MRVRSGRAAQGRASAKGAPRIVDSEQREAEATVGGRWLVRGKDDRLTAYARNRDGLLRWTEERPGGPRWRGPDFIPVPHLTHLSIAQGADSYVHFVGRRSRQKGDGSQTVDIVHAIQYQTGRPLSQWRSLGNPYKDPDRAARIGAPVPAVAGSGAAHVFVRNSGGGIMLRREGKGAKWEAWTDLKGSLAQDAMAASVAESGRIELLVPGSGQAMRWTQAESDGPFEQAQSIPVAIAPGGVAALETAPGRNTFYWTDPTTGGIVAHRLGAWVIPIGGTPAEGPITVLRAMLDGYDCTILAHRDLDGHVMLAACGTENEGGGLWWSPTGERTAATPALAIDVYGRVVLAMIGADGGLYVARQNREPGLAMDPAERV